MGVNEQVPEEGKQQREMKSGSGDLLLPGVDSSEQVRAASSMEFTAFGIRLGWKLLCFGWFNSIDITFVYLLIAQISNLPRYRLIKRVPGSMIAESIQLSAQ